MNTAAAWRRPRFISSPSRCGSVGVWIEQLGHARLVSNSAARRLESTTLKDEEKGEVRIEHPRCPRSHRPHAEQHAWRADGPVTNNESADDTRTTRCRAAPASSVRLGPQVRGGGAQDQERAIDTGDPRSGRACSWHVYREADRWRKDADRALTIVPDPRGDLPQSDLDAQSAFAVRVRDDISKAHGSRQPLRSVQEQLKAHHGAGGEKVRVRRRRTLSRTRTPRSRKRSHRRQAAQPTAEVVYDILAMRGGARLYSRLSPLQSGSWRRAALRPRHDAGHSSNRKRTGGARERDETVLSGDVARINQLASQLNCHS